MTNTEAPAIIIPRADMSDAEWILADQSRQFHSRMSIHSTREVLKVDDDVITFRSQDGRTYTQPADVFHRANIQR